MKRLIEYTLMLGILLMVASCGSEGATENSTETSSDDATPKLQSTNTEGCEYLEEPGIATIIGIGEGEPVEEPCANSKSVRFEFLPDVEEVVEEETEEGEEKAEPPRKVTRKEYLTLDGFKGPSADWLEENGVEVGATFACIRKARKSGDCRPFYYDFVELDMSDMCR